MWVGILIRRRSSLVKQLLLKLMVDVDADSFYFI